MTNEPGPGAFDPYRFYVDEVEPSVSDLNRLSGTIRYFDLYKSIISEIESKRDNYLRFLPGMMIGTAMLKIVFDYYKNLDYETYDTEGEEIDKKYKIDLVAIKDKKIIVAQIKSGEISAGEIKEFCTSAPKYIIEEHPDKETRQLVVVAYKLDKNANETFIEYGKELNEKGFELSRLFPETIMNELPKYRRHFKELAKIHSW